MKYFRSSEEKKECIILSLPCLRLSWVIRFCRVCLLLKPHLSADSLSWCHLQSWNTSFSVLSRLVLSCHISLRVLFFFCCLECSSFLSSFVHFTLHLLVEVLLRWMPPLTRLLPFIIDFLNMVYLS